MHGLFLDLDDKKYKDFICPLSMEFARKLPPFKFEEDPAKRDVLEMRPLVVLPNGALYKGEWNKQTNVREGRGIEMQRNGIRYEGHFKNNQYSGRGRYYHANGNVFEGWLERDNANGKGAIKYFDGSKYEGDWVEDAKTGNGKWNYNDGTSYEGQVVKGKKHGVGYMID